MTTLPHTWRPFGVRMAGSIFGGGLVILLVAVWILLGADERARFTTFQRGTLVFLGLLAFTAWFALVRSRVTATDAVPETVESSLQLSEAVLVDLGVAMGPVIASIHEKRDQLRRAIKDAADLDREPRLRRTRLNELPQ